MARHGPMVWRTCRDQCPCEQDARDVFQTTFLALTRHRGRLAVSRHTRTLGPWLHKVAVLAARELRRGASSESEGPPRLVNETRR